MDVMHLLLIGKASRLQAWAGWLSIQDHVAILTATSSEAAIAKLQTSQVVLIDAEMFSSPRGMLEMLDRIGGERAIHVVLPRLNPAQASGMENVLRSKPGVQGVYHGDIDLDAFMRSLRAKPGTNGDNSTPPTSRSPVIAVWNGAGGVGKTTIATNLAYELGRQGHKTLLIGLDAPDDTIMVLGLRAEPGITHWALRPTSETLSETVQNIGPLHVLAGFRDVFAQTQLAETHPDQPGSVHALLEQARQLYEIIVLDTPQSAIATQVLTEADRLIMVARPMVKGAWRTAEAYRAAVERMEHRNGGLPPEYVHVVLNRVHPGHLLDADRWHQAASRMYGQPFPAEIVTEIRDDVRIGDLQNRRKVPVEELADFRKRLRPLVEAVSPGAVARETKKLRFGFLTVVK